MMRSCDITSSVGFVVVGIIVNISCVVTHVWATTVTMAPAGVSTQVDVDGHLERSALQVQQCSVQYNTMPFDIIELSENFI